jgi:trehalose-6-phosphate synthase
MSSGGLVAALSGIPRESFIWLGWAGCVVPQHEEGEVQALLESEACAPVFLSDQIAKDHYNGFSNGILWPLFHYQTGMTLPYTS